MTRALIPQRGPVVALAFAAIAGAVCTVDTRAQEPIAPHLWTNPGFETGFSGWLTQALAPATARFSISPDRPFTGAGSLRIDITSIDGAGWSDVHVIRAGTPIAAGEPHEVSVRTRSLSDGHPVTILVVDENGETVYAETTGFATREWSRLTAPVLAPRATRVDVFLVAGAVVGSVFFDDVTMVPTPDLAPPTTALDLVVTDAGSIAGSTAAGAVELLIRALLPETGMVRLYVADVHGKELAALFHGDAAAGQLDLYWTPIDGAGAPYPPGHYAIHLDAPGGAVRRVFELR